MREGGKVRRVTERSEERGGQSFTVSLNSFKF